MRAEAADGTSFLPRNSRTRAILAVLALAEAAPVPRKLLMSLLWPSRGLAQAQASLRQSLHELRGCLASVPGAAIVSDGECLWLRAAMIWVDAVFVRTPGFVAPCLHDVLRGPLLAELEGISEPFDAWIRGERGRLSASIRPRLQAFFAASRDPETTAALAGAVLKHDASQEDAWQALVKSQLDRGGGSGALAILAATGRSADLAGVDLGRIVARCVAGAAPPAAVVPEAAGGSRHRSGSAPAADWHGAHLAVSPMRPLGEATVALATEIDWQIISGLCRFENFSCTPVACNDGSRTALHRLAAEGFGFLLEGCVERAGGRSRLAVRLRDLDLRGHVFWSGQLCHAAAGAGRQETDFAARLAPQVAAEIARHQAAVLETSPDWEKTVRQLVLKASRSAQNLDRTGLSETETLFAQAIRRDDRHPALLAWSAYLQLLQLGQGWVSDAETVISRMGHLIDRSLSLKPDSASVLSVAGHVLAFTQNRLEEGLSLQEQALSRNPNLPSAWLFSGLAHTYAGDHRDAISRLKRAKMLSPADQQAYFMDMGLSLSHLLNGDAASSLAASESAILLNPNFSSSFKVAVSAAGHAGPARGGSMLLKRLLALEPELTVGRLLSRSPLTRISDRTCLSDGLRLAGLPK